MYAPYRTSPIKPIELGPRWGITWWVRFYIWFVGHFKFINLRDKYYYSREMNRYRLDMITYREACKVYVSLRFKIPNRILYTRPIPPLPPPIRIME